MRSVDLSHLHKFEKMSYQVNENYLYIKNQIHDSQMVGCMHANCSKSVLLITHYIKYMLKSPHMYKYIYTRKKKKRNQTGHSVS